MQLTRHLDANARLVSLIEPLALRDGYSQTGLPGVQILYPVDANAVFAKLPDKMKAGLKERGWVFYSFIGGGTRLMCSWRTTEADVEAFVRDAEAFAG